MTLIAPSIICAAFAATLAAQPYDVWLPKPNLQSGVNVNAPHPRYGATLVWADGVALLWGGGGLFSPTWPSPSTHADGGMYDPAIDQWLVKPNLQGGVGAPIARSSHFSVWAGSRMVVWGGRGGASPVLDFNDGGSYDPVTDTWEFKPSLNSGFGAPQARTGHFGMWTGTHVVVYGGRNDFDPQVQVQFNGGRYDPLLDTWTSSPVLENVPPSNLCGVNVWVHPRGTPGTLLYLWGGIGGYPPETPTSIGAHAGVNYGRIYDCTNDTWVSASQFEAPATNSVPRMGTHLQEIGRFLTIYGGHYDARSVQSQAPLPLGHGVISNPGSVTPVWLLGTGALYDLQLQQWLSRPVLENALGAPDPRTIGVRVRVGSRFLVWGGTKEGFSSSPNRPTPTRYDTGAMYDPVNDVWDWPDGLNNHPNKPPAGSGWYSVWTGSEVIVYSGDLAIQSGPQQVGWSYIGGVYRPPGPMPQLPGPHTFDLTVGEEFEELIGLWGDPIPDVTAVVQVAAPSVAFMPALSIPERGVQLPGSEFPSGYVWQNPDPNSPGLSSMPAGARTGAPFPKPLPSWMTYNMRRFRGTPPPEAAGVWTVRVTAQNTLGTEHQNFTVSVRMNPVFVYTDTPTAPRPELLAYTNQPFSHQLRCVAHPAPTYSVLGLPSWLSHANGIITGTPPASENGKLFSFTISADNGLGYPAVETLSIRVARPQPLVASAADVNGDSQVNVLDVQHAVGLILNTVPAGAAQASGHPQGDVNHDYQVSAVDVQGIVNWIVGR